jgi:hypothetical protein
MPGLNLSALPELFRTDWRLLSNRAPRVGRSLVYALARLRDGPVERNGVGSAPYGAARTDAVVRRNCHWLPRKRMHRISDHQGGPLRNHLGRMRFSVLGASASRFEIDIVFEGKFRGAGPIFRFILDRGISRGLADLEPDAAFWDIRPSAVAMRQGREQARYCSGANDRSIWCRLANPRAPYSVRRLGQAPQHHHDVTADRRVCANRWRPRRRTAGWHGGAHRR